MNSRNYAIDVLKFVCAVLVVFIHTTDWVFHQEFLPVTRCAVPCFFIISGYLLFDNERRTIEMSRLKRNIGHIGGIILWSTLFYMFWDEFVCICNQGNIWIPSLTRLLKLIFLNVPLFGHQLWYLFSYFYVLLIIWAVVKYDLWKWLFYAVPVLSLVALLERDCLLSLGKCAVREIYLSSIFAAICMFLLALSINSNQKSLISVWGEKYSLYIYIFHPVFVYCCKALLKGTILFAGYTYVAPVVVLLLTMLFVRLLLLVRG